jgi:hypothetical protein
MEKVKSGKESQEEKAICRKSIQKGDDLTGGVMCFWCSHRVCYGFHLIRNGEGRNDVFSPLFTRFPVAPRVIIYDFACDLASYCWMREPHFFRYTQFIVDDLHHKGHKGCSITFKCKLYKMLMHSLMHIVNDSAAESGNAGLAQLKRSARFMCQTTFCLMTRHLLEIHNREAIKRQHKLTRSTHITLKPTAPATFPAADSPL